MRTDIYNGNRMESLREGLLKLVSEELSPIALKYKYSDVALESPIKWKPVVLILGNYSSGKSTLINELLGVEVQATGQAPTDDSFTVITGAEDEGEFGVMEERDGEALLNDSQFPFNSLRKHGHRFSAHFKLKKVNSPFLRDLAIIDTPGMLDSVSEMDRGYRYQEVLGDLAEIADLVLILFDTHKAGTIRESYETLRETLPAATFENRVIFILNRVDECSSLVDLLRVYGTLCWNLSQMTGRKDIPKIYLTYSPSAAESRITSKEVESYLALLNNERENLKKNILNTPRYRIDHLASYIEINGERLAHYLETLVNFGILRKKFFQRQFFIACGLGFFVGLLSWIGLEYSELANKALSLDQRGMDSAMSFKIALGVGLVTMVGWVFAVSKYLARQFTRQTLINVEHLTELNSQRRRDSWSAIKELVFSQIKNNQRILPPRHMRKDLSKVISTYKQGSKLARNALKEITKNSFGRIREANTPAIQPGLSVEIEPEVNKSKSLSKMLQEKIKTMKWARGSRNRPKSDRGEYESIG